MISVIICSINKSYLKLLKNNIDATIGCAYELIAIDNRNTRNGISHVYNETATQAKYNIICFLHEDVIIHTLNWGNVLIDTLADKKVGLVGVSGTVYKSSYPAIWSACDQFLYRTQSIQHFKGNPVITNFNPFEEDSSEVAVLDGVFLATRKEIFNVVKFDEKLLKGFHGYDLDYSLQIGCKYKIKVTFNIILEHFSEGSISEEWFYDYISIHKKWQKVLPRKISNIDHRLIRKSDYLSCQFVLYQVIQNDLGGLKAIYYFSILLTRFFKYNGFKYTRTVMSYVWSRLTILS
jgi:hypothetical protein